MIQQRKLIRFLVLPTGIIGILVIMLVVPFSYTPDTSVPFPYISPPEKGYYIETNCAQLGSAFLNPYSDPLTAEALLKGQSLILKNVRLGGVDRWKTETYISTGVVQFWAQHPSDLKELKEGDKVDIIGVCAGMSKEWPIVVVIENSLFLPAGLVPLPLPGGPAIVIGGY